MEEKNTNSISESKNNFMKFSPSKILFPPEFKMISIHREVELGCTGTVYLKSVYRYIHRICELIFENSAYDVSFLLEHVDLITPDDEEYDYMCEKNVFPATILFSVADGFNRVDISSLNYIMNNPEQLFVIDGEYEHAINLKGERLTEDEAKNVYLEQSNRYKYAYIKIYKAIEGDTMFKIELRCAWYKTFKFVDDVLLTAFYDYRENSFRCETLTIDGEELTPHTIMGILCQIYMNYIDTMKFNENATSRMEKMIADSMDRNKYKF